MTDAARNDGLPDEPDAANEKTGATVSELPSSAPRHGRRWIQGLIRFVLMLVVPIAGIIYGAGIWAESLRYITTENAYVKSHVIAISADVSGRVVEVNAYDNKVIKKGDVCSGSTPILTNWRWMRFWRKWMM